MIADVDWSVGQAVKTPPSHGGNRSSILLRTALFLAQPKRKCCKAYNYSYYPYNTFFVIKIFYLVYFFSICSSRYIIISFLVIIPMKQFLSSTIHIKYYFIRLSRRILLFTTSRSAGLRSVFTISDTFDSLIHSIP